MQESEGRLLSRMIRVKKGRAWRDSLWGLLGRCCACLLGCEERVINIKIYGDFGGAPHDLHIHILDVKKLVISGH